MKKSTLDDHFDAAKNILAHFDTDNPILPDARSKDRERVNIDFPPWVVRSLDIESQRWGVTRQSLIKMWIAEKLQSMHIDNRSHPS